MEKRTSEHVRAQKMARERDRGTCQICGSRNHPEGHHVTDFRFFGKAFVDNMVTLCRKCHKNVHRGKMDVFIL